MMSPSKIITTLLFALHVFVASAQDREPWVAFQNKDSSLIGFKDKAGNIKIAPKFMGYTIAKKFEDIIAVMEHHNNTYKSYYLTKAGEEIGTDSLFIMDYAADCESEGYIRFKDPKTERVGMLDKNGNVAIPAIYNHLSRVNNGLTVALKGAKKKYWDTHNKLGCNHFSWTGGTNYLLNTKNEILVENFDNEGYLDFFSLKISPTLPEDSFSVRVDFKGTNGNHYSFIDHEKVFVKMLNQLMPYDFLKDEFTKICYDIIYYQNSGSEWVSEAKKPFVYRNFELIKSRILHLMDNDSDYQIFVEGLNPYIYQGDEFAKYFNNCGEAEITQYPVMNLVINTKNDAGKPVQDHLGFLKTDQGFKLIGVSIQSEKLKSRNN
ncbi:MAG: hypothetical protein NXH90_13630 [Flavobacteriaceae bacterium]|nr:hypothetical protein [Flavobacteriaceae bacterium]